MSGGEKLSLANRGHLALVVGALVVMGAMCPTCGHGTRATSKCWARCKKCGERVRRRPLNENPVARDGCAAYLGRKEGTE